MLHSLPSQIHNKIHKHNAIIQFHVHLEGYSLNAVEMELSCSLVWLDADVDLHSCCHIHWGSQFLQDAIHYKRKEGGVLISDQI